MINISKIRNLLKMAKSHFRHNSFQFCKGIFSILLGLSMVLVASFPAESNDAPKETPETICAVYISGIGCHNCAVSDPVIFTSWTKKFPGLVVFEYEIWKLQEQNKKVSENYFQGYLPGRQHGIPFLILNKNKMAVGRNEVLALEPELDETKTNQFPLSYGSSLDFNKIDLLSLPGKVKIWTKNRVLVSGKKGDNAVLRKIITEKNIADALKGVDYKQVSPEVMPISLGEIKFEHAVMVGDWRIQWNGENTSVVEKKPAHAEKYIMGLVAVLILLAFSLSLFRVRKSSKGAPIKFELRTRLRDVVIVLVSLILLVTFFMFAKKIPADFIKESGYSLPLPVFTFLIAIVDGFNPCNMFVLTCLLALLISTSDSRKRLYIVSLSFVGMVYVFYFLFMAAWLNVFKYISFITPLRIALGLLALAAGLINCKELLFFRKGFSLMIQDQHKGPLMKRVESMKEIIMTGSMPLLITSSLALAALASLIELPCTAGFPIIYTGVLSGKGLGNTISYYIYLVYYNIVYVIPLLAIVTVFVYTFRARKITQRQMEIIKFIGGIIMVLLGIILLVKPALLGLSVG